MKFIDPLPVLSGARVFRIIFLFNAPFILAVVLFNFWRAYVHADGGACADIICIMTDRHGDASPVVSSFTAEVLKRGGGVNIALARELLFFNVIFGIIYAFAATIAFAAAIPKLKLIGSIKYPMSILVIPPMIALLAFTLYAIGWDSHWPRPNSYRGRMGRLIFDYWAGVFVYNGRSLTLSVLGMLFVFNLFNVVAYLRRRIAGRSDHRL